MLLLLGAHWRPGPQLQRRVVGHQRGGLGGGGGVGHLLVARGCDSSLRAAAGARGDGEVARAWSANGAVVIERATSMGNGARRLSVFVFKNVAMVPRLVSCE